MTVELKTSRYANGAAIVASGLVPVRTSRGGPRFKIPYTTAGRWARLVTPSAEAFATKGEEAFTAVYRAQLDSIGPDDILAELAAISAANGDRGLLLLCFEDVAKGELCHRRLLAEWLEEKSGVVVAELGHEVRRYVPSPPAQGTLPGTC